VTTLFNRVVEFEVGKPGQEGFIFRDLKIAFSITKTADSNANPGRVTITNLSKTTRDRLKDEGLIYKLRVGYAGLNEIPLIKEISSGDVLDISTQRSGTEIVTNFKIGEGTKVLAEKTLDKSFEEGISFGSVIDEFAKALDVTKGAIEGITQEVFNSGYSATGKVKDRLDELTRKQGLEWSVQNGELIILPEDGKTTEQAVLLTQETGLLKAFREKKNKTGQTALVDIIRFSCLLNPDIKVGREIAIFSALDEIGESIFLPAFFKVRKVTFSGDNKDGKFTCEGEAIE
jgi:hypothetical protein